MKLLCVAILILLSACNVVDSNEIDKRIDSIVQQTTQITSVQKVSTTFRIHYIRDEEKVAILTQLLQNKQDKDIGGTELGQLTFYKDITVLLQAKVFKDGIRFTIQGRECSRRFSYQAGRFLFEEP